MTERRSTPQSLLDALRSLLGARLATDAEARGLHGKDPSYHARANPDAVAFAHCTEEVQQIVRACAAHDTPIIPFGAGTSIEGGITATAGGVCLDLSGMDRILAIRPDDMDATVEAGVTRGQLNERLAESRLFFPVDPGLDATFGGMASTRASGTNAVRYGTMRDNVLALTVVLADGRVLRVGSRARKSSAGYDLTRLFVGAEGTLGILTEVTVRLARVPDSVAAAVCPFPSIEKAVRTAIAIIREGVPIAKMELLDPVMLRAVNLYSNLDYAEAPTLYLEFEGSEAGVREQAETVERIAGAHEAAEFVWATDAAERERLWLARKHAFHAALALRPGAEGWPTDVCVPISRLAECIALTQRDLKDVPFPVPLLGHVGDGNFHLLFVLDPTNPEELAIARKVEGQLIHRALEMGGTCSGEHGIGIGKLDFLERELGDAIDVLRAIKEALDPRNLLNPGKVLRAAPREE